MIEMGVDKGILVKVRGDDIAAGSHLLPPAGSEQPARLSTVVDTPNLGRVRITYRLNKSPRRHAQLWFWTACHAECLPLDPDTVRG